MPPESLYLQRYAYPLEFLSGEPVEQGLKLVLVIPSLAEENLVQCLKSIYECDRPEFPAEVIVVINQAINCPGSIDAANELSFAMASEWLNDHNEKRLKTHLIRVKDIPTKDAGVGIARKIGMDEAVRRFNRSGTDDGIIVCYDADCQCDKNYLKSIEEFFIRNPEANAASVYFEHPVSGILDPRLYAGIIAYELHLRYVVHALRFGGYPYAYHTIGSCLAVKGDIYQKQGGMNKRKAGEDFYFLQKIIPLGNYHEITAARVIPSPRLSDRVPFGTGMSMHKWMESGSGHFSTFNPSSFIDLQHFTGVLKDIYNTEKITMSYIRKQLPETLNHYFDSLSGHNELLRIKRSAFTYGIFIKKVYHWFNGLKILKYLHFARDRFYEDVPIENAASWLLASRFGIKASSENKKELLGVYRKIDRGDIRY